MTIDFNKLSEKDQEALQQACYEGVIDGLDGGYLQGAAQEGFDDPQLQELVDNITKAWGPLEALINKIPEEVVG